MDILDFATIRVTDEARDLAKNFILKVNDNLTDTSLLVRIDATHSGYINNNKVYYVAEKMRKSTCTWLEPYGKPVLKHHDKGGDPVGRIINATYMPIINDSEDDLINKPDGFIQLLARISEKETIQQLADGRLQTVSIGASTKEAWCNICDQDLANEGICSHTRGKRYARDEDEVQLFECFWRLGLLEYKECSFVNVPADEYAQVIGLEFSPTVAQMAEVDFFVEAGGKQITLQDYLEGDSITLPDSDSKENINMADPKKSKKVASAEDTTVQGSETPTKVDKETDAKDKKQLSDTDKGKQVDDDTNKDNPDDKTDSDDEETFSLSADELSEEELADMKLLDSELDAELDELASADSTFADAKLSTSARKKLKGSSFCGPNRSFPVPDCAHVTAARRLIGRAKVSDSTKKKILACVSRKANSLGCGSSSNDAVVQEALADKLTLVTEQLQLSEKLLKVAKDEIIQLEGERDRLIEENSKLHARSHKDNAEEVLRLKLALKKPDVKTLLDAEDEEKEAIEKEFLDKLIQRTPQSIEDTLADLRLEHDAFDGDKGSNTLESVESPGLASDSGTDDDDAEGTDNNFKEVLLNPDQQEVNYLLCESSELRTSDR